MTRELDLEDVPATNWCEVGVHEMANVGGVKVGCDDECVCTVPRMACRHCGVEEPDSLARVEKVKARCQHTLDLLGLGAKPKEARRAVSPGKVCAEMCPECPFSVRSPQGYLGAASGRPLDFITPHLMAEVPLPCHMHVSWEEEAPAPGRGVHDAPLCRGFLIFMKNVGKLPRAKEYALVLDQVTTDRENVFATLTEFIEHHRNPE